MIKFNKTSLLAMSILALLAIVSAIILKQDNNTSTLTNNSAIQSQYAGQEARGIKALSQEDIDGLLVGAGTPFGGMAKPGELNGYPGPRHVLDAVEAGDLEVTEAQLEQVENIYDNMRQEAIALGEQIIDLEQQIDDAFSGKTITEALLQEKVSKSANLYGQLRIVHLKNHLSMINILTPQQVEQYNELRGYTSGDPCSNTPEGHDPELWKRHNNCS